MRFPGKFPLGFVLCGLVAAYLVADLFVFHGPLRHQIDLLDPERKASIEKAKKEGVVARVFDQPITRSQLERAISEQLWREGKSSSFLSGEEAKSIRTAALGELVDHELLRHQMEQESQKPTIPPEELAGRFSRFTGRFETKAELDAALKSQGVSSETALSDRLAAQIQQEKFLEQQIAAQIKVNDEEAENWFKENGKSITNPERLEARHIFLPTLDHPPEEAKQKLDEALVSLTEKKKDFATLAKEISEDPATKDTGGALGWMTRDRLPADFSAPLFMLETNQPSLIRTRLGWHLVEVTARKEASEPTFGEAKPEIVSALEATKRREAVANFRKSLRQSAAGKVEILEK